MGRAARRLSPRSRLHTQVHRDRRDRRRGGPSAVSRVGAEREREIISVTSSARPFAQALARRRARETPMAGSLLTDSLTHWDHNLRLRVQSGPLRMVPTVRTLATALCLLGLVAAGIVGGSGLGPTAALARPTPP